MVEVVEAKIEEFESAEACFTSETFGNVCLKVSPLKAKVLKVGDGYSIELIVDHTVVAERRNFNLYLCNPQIINKPVHIRQNKPGWVRLSIEGKSVKVSVEIMRILVSEAGSDPAGNPCVAVYWVHGVVPQC